MNDKDIREFRENKVKTNEKAMRVNLSITMVSSAIYLTNLSMFVTGYPYYLLVLAWFTVVYFIYPSAKISKYKEITRLQYLELRVIQQKYKMIGHVVQETIRTKRKITQYEFELILDMVEEEEINYVKQSMENI